MPSTASLPYREPGIVAILVQSSFLPLLNILSFALDKALYSGLLGQVFLGIAWGTPEQNGSTPTLPSGLSTSLQPFKANTLLSAGVATTGIARHALAQLLARRAPSGAIYAGTSNLLAAYAAGAAINWWDSEFSQTGPRPHGVPQAAQSPFFFIESFLGQKIRNGNRYFTANETICL
ncbi:hypothetical protein HRG_000366 [Hirsutella rhossiliensis]|uniref:Uncharacterized protein n=1 Tax=Hirsutella rhossiliensis TaxID=111463 RepID=A0A9P8N8L4_9HYPO|nr:uncharacterized protein HRG_00366 [Hirsutella rhossiliensis]KAH0967724.1 hypothetical protein HRG_00366 [Hirsutella rhossiliensis]